MHVNRFIVGKQLFRVMILNHVESQLNILECSVGARKPNDIEKERAELFRILTLSITDPGIDARYEYVRHKLEIFRERLEARALAGGPAADAKPAEDEQSPVRTDVRQ